jgi:hypothetical protein
MAYQLYFDTNIDQALLIIIKLLLNVKFIYWLYMMV